MVWLPDGEKKINDMFIRFDMIHECDRHTDRQTPRNTIGRTAKIRSHFDPSAGIGYIVIK